jgi:predicted metal-dependent phosphoesterase TrpH
MLLMAMNTAVSDFSQTVPQNTLTLKRVWETIDADSCPYHYNFHLHTVCSDGRLTPEDLMEQVLSFGLKGLAITDHHSIRGFQRAQIWLEQRQRENPNKSLPHVWTGIEITSQLNGTEVHLLGYGFSPEHPTMNKYLTGDRPKGRDARASEVINTLHQAGGLAVLAHPARYRRSPTELIAEAYELGIDGVEAYYAYGNPQPWQPSLQESQQVKQMAAEYELFTTCGTDTHGSNILMRI